jgi:general secretion pathway protein N
MLHRFTYALLVTLAVGGAGEALAATQTNFDTNSVQTDVAPQSGARLPAALTPGVVVPVPGDPRLVATPREPRGNPLWSVPLKTLNATRERPIFLPSRRAPAPVIAGPPATVVVPPPPPPPPPEKPRLSLVGAIIGDTDSIAVFLDETTRNVVRLKTGENHNGWILQSVRGREATLQKGKESIVISLPVPAQRKAITNATDNL